MRVRWSWALLAAILLVTAVFAVADRAVRDAPHLGFVPRDADWVLATDDLPGVWRGTIATDFYQSLTSEVPSPLNPIQLRVRKESGMRLTPARWQLWMGNTFAVAAFEGETAYVVHPGMLSRIAAPVLRVLRGFSETDGVVAAGTGYYAWRDGFCIASESRELVLACLSGDAVAVEPEPIARTVRWTGAVGDSPLEIALTAVDRLPLEVVVDGVGDRSTLPHEFPSGPWPMEIARVQGLPLDVLRRFVETTAAFWSDRTEQQIDEILTVLPEDAPDTALILTGIETSNARLVVEPDVFLIAAPVEQVPQPGDTIPVYWGQVAGWVLPWWGESFTLCHAMEEPRAYYASGQAVMADNLEFAREREQDSSGRVYIDWQPVAETIEHIILQAAEFELLDGWNRRDASARLAPYARAAAELGETILEGEVQNGRLVLRGNIASPIRAAEETL